MAQEEGPGPADLHGRNSSSNAVTLPPPPYLARGRPASSSRARRGPGQAGAGGAEVGRRHVLVLQAAARRLPQAKPPVRPGEGQVAALIGREGAGRPCHKGGAGRGPQGRQLSLPAARSPSYSCRRHGARYRPGPLCSQQASGRTAATCSALRASAQAAGPLAGQTGTVTDSVCA